MSKKFNFNWEQQFQQVIHDSNFDVLFVKRQQDWRNLQLLDKNFDKKKEKILWPIHEFRKTGPSIAQQQGSPASDKKKFGYNKKRLKALPSVHQVNDVNPLAPMTKNKREQESEDDFDSEDEWLNADFFESSIFWNHEQQRIKGSGQEA